MQLPKYQVTLSHFNRRSSTWFLPHNATAGPKHRFNKTTSMFLLRMYFCDHEYAGCRYTGSMQQARSDAPGSVVIQ
jgi:hypothetical protein